jgi:hypothetical protein
VTELTEEGVAESLIATRESRTATARDANSFDISTPEGFKLYRLRQAYTPDRWGFLGARSPYTPRFVQVALKIYF